MSVTVISLVCNIDDHCDGPGTVPSSERCQDLRMTDVIRRRSASGYRLDQSPHLCQDSTVDMSDITRAIAAATSVAASHNVPPDDAIVVHNSNRLALR
jgi:hypothetical protein